MIKTFSKNLLLLIAIGVLNLNCRSRSISELKSEPAKNHADSVDIKLINQIIQENPKIKTIDQFLEKLPASYLNRFTLMRESKSSQRVDPDKNSSDRINPRAIIYGNDARFIMSFVGSKDSSAYNTLETIEFDKNKSDFVFRTINFPSNESGKIEVSGHDPNGECSICHGSPPRPIWNTYPIWPGAHGGYDDSMELADAKTKEDLQKLKDNQANMDRYKRLGSFSEIYKEDKKYEESSTARFAGLPNFTFGLYLFELNISRIAQRIISLSEKERVAVLFRLFSGKFLFNNRQSPTYLTYFDKANSLCLDEIGIERLKKFWGDKFGNDPKIWNEFLDNNVYRNFFRDEEETYFCDLNEFAISRKIKISFSPINLSFVKSYDEHLFIISDQKFHGTRSKGWNKNMSMLNNGAIDLRSTIRQRIIAEVISRDDNLSDLRKFIESKQSKYGNFSFNSIEYLKQSEVYEAVMKKFEEIVQGDKSFKVTE